MIALSAGHVTHLHCHLLPCVPLQQRVQRHSAKTPCLRASPSERSPSCVISFSTISVTNYSSLPSSCPTSNEGATPLLTSALQIPQTAAPSALGNPVSRYLPPIRPYTLSFNRYFRHLLTKFPIAYILPVVFTYFAKPEKRSKHQVRVRQVNVRKDLQRSLCWRSGRECEPTLECSKYGRLFYPCQLFFDWTIH